MIRMKHCLFVVLIFAGVLCAQNAQPPAQQQQQQQPEFIRKGQQLMREGKLDEALALFQDTLKTSPDSVPANNAAGVVLDLMGKGQEARKYFSKAIEVASTPQSKLGAERAMAMSYAFEGDCKKTLEYEQKVFDYYVGQKDFFQQGEVADEGA
ncbi:MAG TPA: tetratricopeptide repeat protein, partial [Candidatus Angelobacter sp.]|nr:tetratricopeptide repeat protein [Candidatus Angelobacter sp.]